MPIFGKNFTSESIGMYDLCVVSLLQIGYVYVDNCNTSFNDQKVEHRRFFVEQCF